MDIGGVEYTALNMPKLIEFAKEYFNCPTLAALPLENGGNSGSAGSHWDKVFFPHEVMNPTVEFPLVISDITMTFLESTNWYQVS